jgi:hypothetical protein
MGMSIDEALETIKSERWIGCQEKYIEAINLITDTMYKYQKIEEIVGNYGFDTSWLCLKKIREVLEDGSD